MKNIAKAKAVIWKALEKDEDLRELNIVKITDVLLNKVGRLEGGWEKIAELILKRILN